MNISGPLLTPPVHASHQQALDLRLFQRVTAQVLSVTGTTALLSIEGHPIVAQLASANQAETLLPQQIAQFIVTERTNETITLKMIGNDQPQAGLARLVIHGPELAVRLLEQQNIPVSVNHLIIARSILRKYLPVTPALLNDLSEALSSYGFWGSREADLAAALKAAGLPVNAQSLAMASRQAAQIGDSMKRLIAKLTDMAGQDLPDELREQWMANLQVLDMMVLKMDDESSQLAKQLKAAIEILGRSMENILLDEIKNPGTENALLPLVQLQQLAEQTGENGLASAIDEFLKDLQWSQFLNAKPDPIPGKGDWLEMGFVIHNPQQKADDTLSSARLRIARESHNGVGKINPAYTRLILQVDLSPNQTVEVDLSIVDKQIKASMTAPDELWCHQAQEEVPVLAQALRELGFTLKETQIDVGEPPQLEQLSTSGGPPRMTVDIEA